MRQLLSVLIAFIDICHCDSAARTFLQVPLFHPAEVKRLVADVLTLPSKPSSTTIFREGRPTQVYEDSTRASSVRWLDRRDERFSFIYRRIDKAVQQANSAHWHLESINTAEVRQTALERQSRPAGACLQIC